MIYLGFLALLSLLVLIHELGYMAAAWFARIPIASFSFGVGPKAWTRRWGAIEYSLRAIPFGGFVKLDVTADEIEEVPLKRQALFVLGGPFASLLAGLFFFAVQKGIESGLFATGGRLTQIEKGLDLAILLSLGMALLFHKPLGSPSRRIFWPVKGKYLSEYGRWRMAQLQRHTAQMADLVESIQSELRRMGPPGQGDSHELPWDLRAAEPADHHP